MTSAATLQPATGERPRFRARAGRLARTGVIAGVSAAVTTVVFALLVKAIDVPLEVDGEQIPVAGFAMVTLFWSAVGTAMAVGCARWARRPARTFVVTTILLTLVSFGPVLTADAGTATQVSLALSHVLAAAIVIPGLTVALARDGR